MKKKRADERGNLLREKVMEKGEWINIQRGYVCIEYFFTWFYTTRSSFKTNRRTF